MQNSNKEPITLMIFMGQSNMAGRGDALTAIKCDACAGWEFRAVSAPAKLYPIEEPFGYYENRTGEIDDGERKKGSMVSALIDTYYKSTGRKVVAVSASIGGTASDQWVSVFVKDAATRLKSAEQYLKYHQMIPEHIYMVWCQGETDGDNMVSAESYEKNFHKILMEMKAVGVEKCFMIQIGHFNYVEYPAGNGVTSGMQLDQQYRVIRDVQEKICEETDDVFMAASFCNSISLMRDQFHYYQEAYNQVGAEVARAIAEKESFA